MKSAENSFFNFRFIIPLPDRRDSGQTSEESWEVNFRDEIYFDGQTFKLSSPLKVYAVANWVQEGLLSLVLQVETKISGACVRCLDETELAISEELLYLYSSCGQVGEKDEMIIEVKAFGKTLDIVEQVWESLILFLPLKLLCSEECKGLCSSCGAKLN